MSISILGGLRLDASRRLVPNEALTVEGDKIASLGAPGSGETLDASGLLVLPGLVDAHTHGRAGVDFLNASASDLKMLREAYARTGVTSPIPTLASGTREEWKDAIRRICLSDAEFDGIHLEGRYLNPAKRGAHAPELLVPPEASDLADVLSAVSLPCHVTAAFELDADGSFTACALAHGVTLGLGHSNATYAEASLAVSRGVTSFSHLFNTMPPIHHRAGGAVVCALTEDAVYTEMIVDGIHICPETVKLAYRSKPRDKFVLITDSMEATGCPDGNYSIAGQPVVVKDGKALTLDGALAGSTLNLLQGIKNLISFAGAEVVDAVACATINPARMLGIDSSVGSLEVGKLANVILTDGDLNLKHVICRGKLLF